jgi:NNP family nitrate/nitrite transporter-like MFS transporter
LGGGFVQAFLPAVFELFKAFGCSDDLAWRLSLVVPAVFFVIVGVLMLKFSDDCPEGKWADRVEVARGGVESTKMDVFKKAVLNRNTIILVWAYACCFGIELFVNNAASLFLYEQFLKSDCVVTEEENCHVLTQATAGLIASLFGLMNLFARAIGGILSDKASKKWGIGGRFRVLMFTGIGTGVMMIIFSQMTILPIAMICLILFSMNVQAAEGASFGIVPFVDPANKGVVSGLVGAGGNLGAVIWGLIYKEFGSKDQERTGMLVIGCIVTGSALMCLGLQINGAGLFWGEEGEEPGQKNKDSPPVVKKSSFSENNKKAPTPVQTQVKDTSDDEA